MFAKNVNYAWNVRMGLIKKSVRFVVSALEKCFESPKIIVRLIRVVRFEDVRFEEVLFLQIIKQS